MAASQDEDAEIFVKKSLKIHRITLSEYSKMLQNFKF